MNFYETKMGSIFFNSQLPKLISALQDIASALSKPVTATNPDGTAFQNPVPAIRPDGTALPKSAPATNAGSTALLKTVTNPDGMAFPKPTTVTNPDGAVLPKPVPAINMDGMADPDFLHDLLYWMYETEVFGNREQLAPFDADVTQAEKALLPALGQSQELFEQYQAAVSRRNDAEIERAFCSGYRAGANAFLNGLFAPQPQQTGGAPDGE
jgi:hypothetical protein|nr:hypothetical protein [uncultured Acetatifactor sp.]